MNLRLVLTLAGVASIFLAGAGLYWKGRMAGVAAERPKVAAALDRAEVAGLEVEGARTSAARVDVVVRQTEAAAQTVAKLTPVILNSEAAHVPLDPERGARLRSHDRELCQLAHDDLAGCAPAP
jgi:hypothetical protein